MNQTEHNLLQIIPALRGIFSGESLVSCKFCALDDLSPAPDQTHGMLSLSGKDPGDVLREAENIKAQAPFIIDLKHYGRLFVGRNSAESDFLAKQDREDLIATDQKTVFNLQEVQGRVKNRITIITGAAQGFGKGIATDLFAEGADIIIADLNEEAGLALAKELNASGRQQKAFFVKTDVSNPESVQELILKTVTAFGGLDIMISNAGVLRAGGLDEMEPETFEFMTRVNYTGYFYCAKYASSVMKVQNEHRPGHHTDILQINSKSGLKGSRKNFAYAGGKFGGIGLTQSFALELMSDRIKVNSICPGNFFDGPLWSDPERGLFIQYLNAGKVPGAKSIEDVKKFYESQVPAGRGCEVKDVTRAILYAIEQEYETGQAIPVTGGQNMLN